MCGIAGFIGPPNADGDSLNEAARVMAQALEARGPDDAGTWVDAQCGVAFGHRRLSIIDLSAEGHQPMASVGGRYTLSFNGEIYNFVDLRNDLLARGHTFRGHSDTEVLLAAVVQWGVRDAATRLVGMFAIALWDRQERCLHLVRDRLGEKPLYYGWSNGVFYFGSELKAIRAHPSFRPEVDREAVTLFLRYGYVPTPRSIYSGIYKLPPGTILTISLAEAKTPSGVRPVPYWSALERATNALADPFLGTEEEAATHLERLLRTSIQRQMVADVPLGALLSGGVDSSTVAALMQSQSGGSIRTFTIGFREDDFNEAAHASAVARHLRTEHTEMYVSGQDALDVIEELPSVYDEPFADPSQMPTLLLSRLIRKHVTVALSGDGGDEMFGGYNRYLMAPRIWRRTGWMPRPVRRVGQRFLQGVSPVRWERFAGAFSRVAADYGTQGTFGDKMYKLGDVLAMPNPEALYHRLVSLWDEPLEVVRGGSEPHLPLRDPSNWLKTPDFVSRMMFLDAISYLPDDILTKVDRAGMAASLEVRVPMLDHHVVEFAWRLPPHMRISGGQTKRILRRVLYRHVPRELIERPKMGFGPPLGAWLRGPLRDWAEDLLDPTRLKDEGYLEVEPIRQRWDEHLSGRRNWQSQLWCVLMFQAWRRRAGC